MPLPSPGASTMHARKSVSIAALAHPRMLATSITLPLEILRAAAQATADKPTPRVVLHLLTNDGKTLELADGLSLNTTMPDQAERPDVLLIPAIWRNPRWVLRHHSWQIDFIRHCIDGGSRICSVGSGSFLVAETGLLDGRDATTHWHWFDAFEQRFPAVRLRRDQLITQSEQIFCVGSVNSIADLMVYLSGLLFSRSAALAIENQFSPEIRRRFSPHSLLAPNDHHSDEKVLDAQLALRHRLQEPLDLKSLAASVELSPRTLNRRFKLATGLSPGAYLTASRIAEARTLLHHSNLDIGEVGWTVGYRDASRFSRQFKTLTGMSPRRYRTAVRGKSFNAADTLDNKAR